MAILQHGYTATYWCIDVHDTIVPSTYTWPNKYDITKYDKCLETLKLLSDMPDHRIILWSCTSHEHIQELINLLKEYDINIDYFNENPECVSKGVCDFSKKFFMDIGIDDKFFFDPFEDWKELYEHLSIIHTHGIDGYLGADI